MIGTGFTPGCRHNDDISIIVVRLSVQRDLNDLIWKQTHGDFCLSINWKESNTLVGSWTVRLCTAESYTGSAPIRYSTNREISPFQDNSQPDAYTFSVY